MSVAMCDRPSSRFFDVGIASVIRILCACVRIAAASRFIALLLPPAEQFRFGVRRESVASPRPLSLAFASSSSLG